MSFRKRDDKYLVTAEFGADELGVRRRVCRTVDTEDEAKRLDAKLQHEIYEGRHIQPSSESVAAFCARYLDDHEAGIDQRPENPNMDKAAIRRLVTVPASSLDGLFLASAQQYAPRLAERLAERLPERFGKSQLCSSSTQLNPALSAPAREEPVDNSPAPEPEDQERGRSIDQQEQPEPERPEDPPVATDTCDGKSCAIHELPASAFGPLRRAIARSKHPEQWREVGTNGPLDALLAEYSGHLCAACQAGLGEYERPQLDGLCEQALVASLEGLKGAEDVAAVLRSRLHRYGLAELVGDRTFEELRRAKRDKRRRGSTKAISDCLPPEFAQPQDAAKSCEPASVAG